MRGLKGIQEMEHLKVKPENIDKMDPKGGISQTLRG